MKRTIPVFIALFVSTTAAITATAAGGPSVELGRELFNSTSLGTNGKSCASCHPQGKGLEGAAASGEKRLEKIANLCIVQTLKGKELDSGSSELDSLVRYMKTLGIAHPK